MNRSEHTVSLWRRWVALWRLLSLVAVTLMVALSLAAGRVVLSPWSEQKRRWRIRHFHAWSRASVYLIGGRTQWHGVPPERPFFMASNHLSYLDIVVLAQRLPAVFVSKADVKHWPVIGWLTRLADTLYINRERRRDIPRANTTIREALQRGDGVVLFPEGTSSESDFVLPVRPPLLEVAASESYPVYLAAVYFETQPGDPHAHRAICYYGDMSFGPHVWRLLHLKGFTATVRFADEPVASSDRKHLAEQVRQGIHSLQTLNFPATQSSKPNATNNHKRQNDHLQNEHRTPLERAVR
ncbi:MAG: lysophospholipid acyltransferase family protein [Pseudomonadota bacterium]